MYIAKMLPLLRYVNQHPFRVNSGCLETSNQFLGVLQNFLHLSKLFAIARRSRFGRIKESGICRDVNNVTQCVGPVPLIKSH